jgi:hypothetical protein
MARKAMRKTISPKRPARRNRFAGKYSFRFAGFGRGPQAESFYVAGVGRMDLHVGGGLSGTQYFSECPMTNGGVGAPPSFQHGTFQLVGKWNIARDGTGTVSIDFMQGGNIIESDVFRVVSSDAAATRFWLISTNPTVGGVVVPELVSAEAVRLR